MTLSFLNPQTHPIFSVIQLSLCQNVGMTGGGIPTDCTYAKNSAIRMGLSGTRRPTVESPAINTGGKLSRLPARREGLQDVTRSVVARAQSIS